MAGIYVHIPFCRSRCIYCGFYSTTGLDLRQRYVDAVCREISIRGTEVCTIYLGGGTPSQLTIPQLKQIFEALYIYNKVGKETEVTIEVNPDDITEEFAKALASLPVNRISMGVQTFHNDLLRFLHRRHDARRAVKAVEQCLAAGFRNLSIDLIYGLPGQDMTAWRQDVAQAFDTNQDYARVLVFRFKKDGFVEKLEDGTYKKLGSIY